MALIELGLVDGNYFADEHVDAIEAAINQCAPAGTVVMTIAVAAPVGWLFLAGQVIANAQTLYPDLWTVAPAAWKSGAALTLPNMANTFVRGAGTTALDTTGGSDTLAQANLPAVPITINPPSTAVTGNTGVQSVDHIHRYTPPVVQPSAFGSAQVGSGPDGLQLFVHDTGIQEPKDHTHPAGTLTVDIAPFDTANLGSGTPFAPTHLALNFMIKTH